jgi:hypothetical protein
MDYVRIRSYDNYIPAHIALGRLQSAYISCYLQDEHTITIDPLLTYAIGGIKLMVAKNQAEWALDILDEGPEQPAGDSAFPS